MQGVIVAAGTGSRLGELTQRLPKCLLEVNGRTLLDHQIAVLTRNGIDDVTVVTGHQSECFRRSGPRYLPNTRYDETNVLYSLMLAVSDLRGPLIATYSDILFRTTVVAELLRARDDIAIVVDTDWRRHYAGRAHHPVGEAEKVVYDDAQTVREIGKHLPDSTAVRGEFIGMLHCTERGVEMLKAHYARAREEFGAGAFLNASRFDRAYVTDFLQYLVNESVTVRCVVIRGGWMEIDTAEDLEKARAHWHVEEVQA